MSQLNYQIYMDEGQRGLKADVGFDSVLSYSASEDLDFGLGVQLVSGTEKRAKQPDNNTDVFLGVTLRTHTMEQNLNGQVFYKQNQDEVNVLSKGRVYCYVEQSVSPGDDVYVRYDAGASGEPLGAFTNTSTPASGSTFQVNGARFLKDVGNNLAIIEFNLPA